jgi:hypothetical protein
MSAPTTSILLNQVAPAAPSGDQNVTFVSDGATPLQSITAYPKKATASLRGVVKPDGVTTTVAADGTMSAVQPSGPANEVLATPNGSSGTAALRALIAADIPSLPESKVTNLVADLAAKVPTSRTIATTAPLTGGGDLSVDRTLAISAFTGDMGSGGAAGAVPAPPAGSAAAGKFLKADGTFAVPATAPTGIVSTAGITIDGGGSTPATGSKGFLQIPFAGTITGWTLIADVSGSASITVKKSTFAGFPTTTSIVAAAPPALSSQQNATSTTLTGWTTAVAVGDVLEFVLASATTLTRLVLELQITRS